MILMMLMHASYHLKQALLQKGVLALLCVILLSALNLQSQNLIKNGDFEEYYQLPYNENQLEFCKYAFNPSPPYTQTQQHQATPDYFHTDGYYKIGEFEVNLAFPISGKGFVGYNTYLEFGENSMYEYVVLSLSSPLVAGVNYKVVLYTTNGVYTANMSRLRIPIASNTFQVVFSDTMVRQISRQRLDLEPAFSIDTAFYTEEWVEINFEYRAKGGEQYMVLGNFREYNETLVQRLFPERNEGLFKRDQVYFFVDNVSVELISSFPLSGDTLYKVCKGDTVDLVVRGDSVLHWYDVSNNRRMPNDNNTLVSVSPSVSGLYRVAGRTDTLMIKVEVIEEAEPLYEDAVVCMGKEWVHFENPSLLDSVFFTPLLNEGMFDQSGIYHIEQWKEGCSLKYEISYEIEDCEVVLLFPNVVTPNGDGVNDYFKPIRKKGIVDAEIEIYNRWGKIVYQSNHLEKGWSGADCADGVYYWKCNYTDRNGKNADQKSYVIIKR